MKKTVFNFFLLLSLILSLNVHALNRCLPFYSEIFNLSHRIELTKVSHSLSVSSLLDKMRKKGSLVYTGNHQYIPGTEFLASNEFDWSKMPIDKIKTDLVIGFGTNNVWDISVRKKAKQMVIADWSPWPIIAQEFLIAPLIKIAQSPAEFILMMSGISPKYANNMNYADAFLIANKFDKSTSDAKTPKIKEFLIQLASDSRISELELKFLVTYFRAKMGDNINPEGFGPFQLLRDPIFAMFNIFYNERYSPKSGSTENTFSSLENFNHLKKMFYENNVSYAITSITDLDFYRSIQKQLKFQNNKSITLTVTNIFDCGCYNKLTFNDFQNYLRNVLNVFKGVGSPLTVYRTTSSSPPHGFYRYELRDQKDIPKVDEFDSTALIKEAI